jgi:hypothetical protein
VSDVGRIKELLLERIEELAPHLYPNGRRILNHWRVGSVDGEPGKSFDICMGGAKAGMWGDFAEQNGHSRNLLDLWIRARKCDFATALREAREWLGISESSGRTKETKPPNRGRRKGSVRGFDSLDKAIEAARAQQARERKEEIIITRRDWYHSADGEHALLVVRFDGESGKTFRPFHNNGSGRWEIADPPGQLPLYHLPKLLEPELVAEPIVWGEGEKVAEALEEIGVLSTTNAHGSQSPQKTDWEPVAGRLLVCLPDNDKTGQACASKVGQIVLSLSRPAIVKIVNLPGLPDKGDAVDWIAARRAEGKNNEEIKAELLALIEQTNPISSVPPLPQGTSLTNFAEMDPAEFEKDTLLGRRALCRKGVMLLVGPTAVGKSTVGVQMDILWALGREAFGIRPRRPLKILCIQAENDTGDMHEMAAGVMKQLGLSEQEREQVRRNTLYIEERGAFGREFLALLRALVREHRPDLVRIDPLHAYAGGDLRDAKITTPFLRNGLNPILEMFNCAAIINHHTTKMIYNDPSKWTPDDWAYAGAGGAEIANFPRVTLAIQSTNTSGIYKFHAGKRWRRFEWANQHGDAISERVFCWHSENIFWREADETDLLRIQVEGRKAKGGKIPEDLFNLVPPTGTIPKDELFARAHLAEISRDTTRELYRILIADERIFEWSIPRKKARAEKHVSRTAQPQPEFKL